MDIEVGQSVNIKRTDGRVHSAMVSKVNPAARSVTVEWYERGETKGKEVELDAILQLNAELAQSEAAASQPKITKQSSAGGGGGSSGALEAGGHQHQMSANPLSRNPTQGAIRSGISKLAQSTLNGHRTTRQSMAADQIENIPPTVQRSRLQPPSSRLSMPAVNNNNHNNQLNTTSAAAAALAAAQAQAQQAAAAAAAQAAAAQAAAAAAAASAPPITQPPAGGQAGRRSYVVKEVERLKENREKRRARQAEIKEEKVALMNMDPGNPNWELAAMIREFQSLIDFRPLADGAPIEDHQITVCVRKRPVSRKELMKKELDVICVPTKDQLIVHEPKTKVDLTKFLENHKFRFDYSFDDSCTNEMVYKYTAKPLVNTIFEGGMATCFAYGQTGSGKTHTMGGQFNGKQQDCKNGIYALAAHDVFAQLNGKRYRHLNLVVSTSFFEIYSGKVFDLLSDKQKLRVLEDGKQQVQVVGLTEKVVDSVDEVLKIIQHGNATRTSGQTSANANSSRSHAVFQIVLRPPGSSRIHGKFSFIDLAGNERGADTSSANRQTRMEGAEINKSLLALKECIRALGKQSAHLPFRVSKLTQVLRDSFIGEKSKTCMIAMISPGLMSVEHTLNTLRYANRVKELVVPAEGGGADGAGGGMAAGGRGAGDDEDDELLEDMMESDDQKNGSGGNNGDHLRSLSEHEMSDDVLNQHAAISDLQQTEEILVDQHKAMNEFLAQFLPESQKLHTTTNYVEYDQDSYCKRGEELFTQLAELATDCRDLMAQFRNKLANEELLSYNVNGHPAGKR